MFHDILAPYRQAGFGFDSRVVYGRAMRVRKTLGINIAVDFSCEAVMLLYVGRGGGYQLLSRRFDIYIQLSSSVDYLVSIC